jgi:hypothetical protein
MMLTPSQADFLTSLGLEPSRSEPEAGYWEYRLSGRTTATLLSFDIHEGSVQTTTMAGDVVVATFSCEAATRLWIDDERTAIRASFAVPGDQVELEWLTAPEPRAVWSLIRIA